MDFARLLKRLLNGDKADGGGAASLRNLIVWVFIALVALFLTQPSGGPFSATGMQVPWPAELGLDGSPGAPGHAPLSYRAPAAGRTAARHPG